MRLGRTVFDMNEFVNSGDWERAKTLVAEEAEPAFEEMIQGFRDKKYNLLMSNDSGKIDYLEASAIVPVHFFLGNYTSGKPQGQEVKTENQLWKYGIGGWKWYGSTSK